MRCVFFITNSLVEKLIHHVPKFPHKPNVPKAFSHSAAKTPVSPER